MARICITSAEKFSNFWSKRNIYRKICPALLSVSFSFFSETCQRQSQDLSVPSTMGRRWKKLGGGGNFDLYLAKNVPALQISNWASPLPAMHFSFLPGLFLFGGGDPRLALLDKHHLIVNKVQRGSNRTRFQEWRGSGGGCLFSVNICFWTSQYILLSFIWLVNS